MAIEYTFSRVEPCVNCDGHAEAGKVCSVVVGMTAVDGDHSAYVDTTVPLSGAGVVVPESLDLAAICNGAADDGDWKVNLAAQIDAQKDAPYTWTGVVTPPAVS
jgi:hypothetical protein|tara:strand:- start:181 stop:492 length:312 start_codon:yes stop_codon:yes gene_type:complete